MGLSISGSKTNAPFIEDELDIFAAQPRNLFAVSLPCLESFADAIRQPPRPELQRIVNIDKALLLRIKDKIWVSIRVLRNIVDVVRALLQQPPIPIGSHF